MSETTLIVVRHGETEWNISGRWQGHDDSPLTKNGHLQAKAVGKAIADFRTDAIYSSDLGRALQTAEYLSASTGHSIIKDERLRERKLGVFQGLTTTQMKSDFPEEYALFRKGDPDYRVPDGESVLDRLHRSIECFNQLVVNHTGETVVVVTHGGVLDGLFRHVVGLPLGAPRNYKIWNCSLNLFAVTDNSWRLDSFGDISHLRTISTLDDL